MSVNGTVVVEEPVGQLRALWEETSFQLELLQAEPRCVEEEKQGLKERTGPRYCLPPTFPIASVPCKPGKGVGMGMEAWVPGPALGKVSGVWSGWVTICSETRLPGGPVPRVAILREEGSNGDREMADAFHLAGFEVSTVASRAGDLDSGLGCMPSDGSPPCPFRCGISPCRISARGPSGSTPSAVWPLWVASATQMCWALPKVSVETPACSIPTLLEKGFGSFCMARAGLSPPQKPGSVL